MEPVTDHTLAANAFRTLGVSGVAGQAAIEAAARKMRIWPDASHIPPTEWDVPELGPVPRSRSQIEQAVSLLHQPGTRLEHRLLWFAVEKPPGAELAESHWSQWPALQHARLVAGLQLGWSKAGDVVAEDERWAVAKREDPFAKEDWPGLVGQLVELCRSLAMAEWMEQLESAGGFDKPATPAEIAAAIEALPARVARGLIKPAVAGLGTGKSEQVDRLIAAIRQAPAGNAGWPTLELLDRIEDLFFARAGEMEQYLRNALRTDRLNPERLYHANYERASAASEQYRERVAPVMRVLLAEAAEDADRIMRVRSRGGAVLVLLALGWEWSGRFIGAEDQLNQALEIAAGTVAELDIRHALARVSPQAQVEAELLRSMNSRLALSGAPIIYPGPTVLPTPLDPPSPPPKRKPAKRKRRPLGPPAWGIIIAVWCIVRAVFYNAAPHDDTPQFDPQQFQRDWQNVQKTPPLQYQPSTQRSGYDPNAFDLREIPPQPATQPSGDLP